MCYFISFNLQYNVLFQGIIIGPYEHHSNILPWKETGAKVSCIELIIKSINEIFSQFLCNFSFQIMSVI